MSPYIFRTVPSDYIAAKGLADYMHKELKQQKVTVFYNSQNDYSQSLASEFISAVFFRGGQVISEFDFSDANFSPVDSLQQAMNGGAEVIMLAVNTEMLDQALQVIAVNRQRLNLLGGDGVYNPKTLQIAGEFAEDMVLAIPWHIRDNLDTEFAQISRQLW